MKILVAVDENPYSLYAVDQAAKFAANTWADVVLLAVEPDKAAPADADSAAPAEERHPMIRMLRNYRSDFLKQLGGNPDLYTPQPDAAGFSAVDRNVFEEKSTGGFKEFRLRLRSGPPAKSILAEARESQSDLVIIGCGQGGCEWEPGGEVPGKVADKADCSVLVIKEDKRPAKMVCCLDHANVTQESLEMINQLVTLYGVDLEIAGILKKGGLADEVERKMGEVLDYYLRRGVTALVKVVDEKALESFISMGARTDLMALWLSPKSALMKLFPSGRVGALVNKAVSSVLILR